MNKKLLIALMAITIPSASIAQTGHDTHHTSKLKPTPPPIGVMGSHTHKAGESMLSYSFGRMSGTQKRGNSGGEMLTNMHILGGMYAPSDNLTIMAMVPYKRRSMKMTMMNGMRMSSNSDGFGDAKLSALITIFEGAHIGVGISLPTGSIDETARNMMGMNVRLPYSMQMGSGTYDFIPSITYNGHDGDISYGSQLNATIRFGENDNNYTLGNRVGLSGWAGYPLNDMFSTTIRLDGNAWGDIDGTDTALVNMLGPVTGAESQGGTKVDGLVGVNFFPPKIKGRFAVEAGAPIYEKLNGSHMSNNWKLSAGWKAGF